jgi:hypothetical protein
LKAIDREREHERESNYKDQIHKLWDRYQKDENDIEKDLFNEEEYQDNALDYAEDEEDSDDYRKKKKRQVN